MKKKEIPKKLEESFYEYEANILEDDDVIIIKNIPSDKTEFKHGNTTYKINNKYIYLMPTEKSYKPVLFYKKGNKNPFHFENKNKGIPSRALHLLWDKYLYSVIMTFDNPRINKLVVILLLVNAILFGIGLYKMYGGQ